MYGATGVIPVSDGTATIAGTTATRVSFAPGAGTTIPLLNPAWNSSAATAWSVPYLNPVAYALNRALLAGPDTNMNNATFGKIVQPQFNSPRSVQMGLKLYF